MIQAIKKIVFVFIAFLLFVILLDIGLRIIVLVKNKISEQDEIIDNKTKLSTFKNVPWAREYFRENKACQEEEYFPYYEWRTKEFHGKFINVNPDGIRKTWNPELKDISQAKKIFCFGGSTMWGHGVRDEFTIPSLLSKKFAQDGKNNFYFVNYGEGAYCLTQELIFLTLLLKNGIIPDYAIFYDGVNEVLTARQNNRAGLIMNLEAMREKLHYKKPAYTQMFLKGLSGIIERESPLIKLVKDIRNKCKKCQKRNGGVNPDEMNKQIQLLSEEIVRDYKRNIDLLDRLATSYAFKYLLFWQPVVFLTNPLTDEEKGFDLWQDTDLIGLYERTYVKICHEIKSPNFYVLSSVLDNKNKSLYIDFCHLSEDGNTIIADKIYSILSKRVNYD